MKLSKFRFFTEDKPAPPSVARQLQLPVALVTLYAISVYLIDSYNDHFDTIPANAHTALGTVLGVLLVFRTNTAYDRWWEGRKLWGQLVNDMRNFSIKVRSCTRIHRLAAWDFGRLLVNFARALKEHLREGVRAQSLSLYQRIDNPVEPKHIPLDVAILVRERVASWRREDLIDGYDELLLDPHMRALMDVCGACERIRRTPLVPRYRMFVRQCIVLYLLTLPWGLVHDLKYLSIVAVGVISYLMMGMELVAEEIAEPFGRGEDDLMLDDICRSIEASVEEVFREGAPGGPAGGPSP